VGEEAEGRLGILYDLACLEDTDRAFTRPVHVSERPDATPRDIAIHEAGSECVVECSPKGVPDSV
jgi:hypothetical protein